MSGDAVQPSEAASGAEASQSPSILVIVVHWNDEAGTARCLDSLAELTYPNAAVLVIDNASTDGSGQRLEQRYADVEFIHSPTNTLFAGGANLGFRRAVARGCAYTVVLNNDTRVAPDLLEELVAVAEHGPDVGLVGPKIYYMDDPARIWSAGGRINYWSGLCHHIGLRQEDAPQFSEERDVDYLTGCCVMASHRVLIDVGYMDPDYFMYSEDADWSVRVRRAGLRVRYAPRARVWHEVSAASGGGTTPFKMYHRVRSNLMLMARYARPWHWLTIPIALPVTFAVFAAKQLRRRDGSIVRAGLRALVDMVRRTPRRLP